MAKSGTVTSWKGPFGFVEMEDGTSIFIASDDIEGGRLRVGLTVNFDTEEGKEGKLKGVNVKGEAVLAKGAELTDEQRDEDRKRATEIKEKRFAKAKEEVEPVWEAVQKMTTHNQIVLLKRLGKDMGADVQQKRADPTQKKGTKYTKGEFVAFYGKMEGLSLWKQAAPGGRKKMSKTITKE